MCVPFYTQYIYEKVFSLYYYECVGLKTVTQQKNTTQRKKNENTMGQRCQIFLFFFIINKFNLFNHHHHHDDQFDENEKKTKYYK